MGGIGTGLTGPAASARSATDRWTFPPFSPSWLRYNYEGWAVLEWECCIKDAEQGAAEGAPFIEDHIIKVTERAFDDFAGGAIDEELIKKIIGL
jgi:hypothetical protein